MNIPIANTQHDVLLNQMKLEKELIAYKKRMILTTRVVDELPASKYDMWYT